jgi:hypothetical protein
MQHKTIATVALVMMTTSLTFATGSVSIPHVFSSGQAAKASEVNANFQALADAINANDVFARADAFSVTTASGLLDGSTQSINGSSFTMKTAQAISFAEGVSTTYKVIYPLSAGAVSGYASISDQADHDGFGTGQRIKTSINGYPAGLVVVRSNSFTPYGNSKSGSCNVVIKLDADTYFSVGLFPSVSGAAPMTKPEQESVVADCKNLMNYLTVSTVVVPS